MTQTTHAIIGAGTVAIFAFNPALGICAAFASHFVIDTIPHWSYKVKSDSIKPHGKTNHIKIDLNLIHDMFFIGIDIFLGIILSLLFFATPQNFWLIFIGACTGILPDVLQFVYSKFKHEPLTSLQKIHDWVHTIIPYRPNATLGVISQILFIIIFVTFIKIS